MTRPPDAGDPNRLLRYLGRSENRIRALAAVARKPRTRPALSAETGVPRATLCRVLAELRDRGLVAVNGDRYATTSLGRSIEGRLLELCESIETVRRLQWGLLSAGSGAPAGLMALAGSRLTLSTPADPAAPTRRLIDLVGGAARVGLIAPTLVPDVLWCGEVAVLGGRELDVEADIGVEVDSEVVVVVSHDVLESTPSDRATAPTPRPRPSQAAAAATVYAYHGEVPFFGGYADGTAFAADADTDGTVRGCIESDDEPVRSRIEVTVEAYRLNAEPVPAGVLTP